MPELTTSGHSKAIGFPAIDVVVLSQVSTACYLMSVATEPGLYRPNRPRF